MTANLMAPGRVRNCPPDSAVTVGPDKPDDFSQAGKTQSRIRLRHAHGERRAFRELITISGLHSTLQVLDPKLLYSVMMRHRGLICGLLLTAATASCQTSAPPDRRGQYTDRDDALARARVFHGEFRPDYLANGDSADGRGNVTCRFLLTDASGTSPKFDCELPNGERVKIKYGENPEIQGEIAATRLLIALGFGADRVSLVPSVRCYGCPLSPFYTRWVTERLFLNDVLKRAINYDEYPATSSSPESSDG